VGPGAGFAFLSSFLVLLVAFLSSLFSLITFPLRYLYWAWKRRKVMTRAKVNRLVILGLDGMDPKLCNKYMNEGKMPNLARLRDQGTFMPLQTTYPAISPVAWSSFQTGVTASTPASTTSTISSPATSKPTSRCSPPRKSRGRGASSA
jgi:hypothetical protein